MEWLLQHHYIVQYAIIILAGVLYGGIVGLIPCAGPGKAAIMLFAIVNYFDVPDANYLFVLFSIATIVSCAIGDSFAGVLIGVPGGGGAAATMVDGYPLAKQGRASYALSAAITCSTVMGLLYGLLGIIVIPYYENISQYMGVPEIFGLVILAFSLMSTITTNNTFKSLLAIGCGLYIGSIGFDIFDNNRHTFGWEYLEDGVPIVIVAAGLFAIPEFLVLMKLNYHVTKINFDNHNKQTWEGILAVWKHKWLALMGGGIGWIVGILPGTGGGIGDWSAYAATVSLNKNEKIPFGKGNIKGIIGCEGSNNTGKMGGLLPTIMFGIPSGKLYAILMALWMYVGFDVGEFSIMEDTRFINCLLSGYMWGTLISGIVMLIFARHLSKVIYIPAKYWMPPMMITVIWAVISSRHYNTVWEDLFMLSIFSVIGFIMKKYKFSRPCALVAFILFKRIETSMYQLDGIYFSDGKILNNPVWTQHPIMTICVLIAICLIIYGISTSNKNMVYT
tara:strand:- start:832 stop:2343 length:1512 start_codon:yes stop_codon:yes gene_type:complete